LGVVAVAISVISVVLIFVVYLWWVYTKDMIEDEEFLKAKGFLVVNPRGETPSSKCPICGEQMDMKKTQKVMFIKNIPEVCCMKHTAREMTDYIKNN
jgi:hypothetical protein